MEKHSIHYYSSLNRIESAKRSPKRLRMVRGMLFGGWTLAKGKFYEGEVQKLIDTIDDYQKGELGW